MSTRAVSQRSDVEANWLFPYKGKATALVLRCVFIAVATTMLFIAILYAGNTGSADVAKARFQNIEASSLRFTECEVGLSLIIEQDKDFISALMPKAYPYGVNRPCEDLLAIIEDPSLTESTRLRPRYWWGFKSIYSLLLTNLSINQISRVMEVGTYIAYFLLGIGLIRLGGSVFLVLSPFVFIAPFFSGVSFHTEAPIALGFFWAISTSAAYTFLINSKLKENWIYPFVMFAGMISAFLWFMGGELLLVVPLLMLINFLTNQKKIGAGLNFINTAFIVIVFHIGFVASMLIGYSLKAAVYGLDPVIMSFAEAASHRLSFAAKGIDITSLGVLKELFYRGFQHTAVYDNVLLWKALTLGAVMSGGIGALYLIRNTLRAPAQYGFVLFMFFSVFIYLLARALAVPNHSFIHSWMIGRYMIVPICLCLTMSAFAICDYISRTPAHRNQ